jgi:hypothetical protein
VTQHKQHRAKQARGTDGTKLAKGTMRAEQKKNGTGVAKLAKKTEKNELKGAKK